MLTPVPQASPLPRLGMLLRLKKKNACCLFPEIRHLFPPAF